MRLPVFLALTLLLVPMVTAAGSAQLHDPAGDQTTRSNGIEIGGAVRCRDGPTDVTAAEVASVGDTLVVRVEVASWTDGFTCGETGDQAFLPATREWGAALMRLDDGRSTPLGWLSASSAGDAVAAGGAFLDQHGQFRPAVTVSVEGDTLVWTVPLQGLVSSPYAPQPREYDLRGLAVTSLNVETHARLEAPVRNVVHVSDSAGGSGFTLVLGAE